MAESKTATSEIKPTESDEKDDNVNLLKIDDDIFQYELPIKQQSGKGTSLSAVSTQKTVFDGLKTIFKQRTIQVLYITFLGQLILHAVFWGLNDKNQGSRIKDLNEVSKVFLWIWTLVVIFAVNSFLINNLPSKTLKDPHQISHILGIITVALSLVPNCIVLFITSQKRDPLDSFPPIVRTWNIVIIWIILIVLGFITYMTYKKLQIDLKMEFLSDMLKTYVIKPSKTVFAKAKNLPQDLGNFRNTYWTNVNYTEEATKQLNKILSPEKQASVIQKYKELNSLAKKTPAEILISAIGLSIIGLLVSGIIAGSFGHEDSEHYPKVMIAVYVFASLTVLMCVAFGVYYKTIAKSDGETKSSATNPSAVEAKSDSSTEGFVLADDLINDTDARMNQLLFNFYRNKSVEVYSYLKPKPNSELKRNLNEKLQRSSRGKIIYKEMQENLSSLVPDSENNGAAKISIVLYDESENITEQSENITEQNAEFLKTFCVSDPDPQKYILIFIMLHEFQSQKNYVENFKTDYDDFVNTWKTSYVTEKEPKFRAINDHSGDLFVYQKSKPDNDMGNHIFKYIQTAIGDTLATLTSQS
jgi:uncharacterized protein YacL